jgi:hypothetical protein
MLHDDPRNLAKITRDALKRAGRRPPLKVFEDLVAQGLIDANGRVIAAGNRRRTVRMHSARRDRVR